MKVATFGVEIAPGKYKYNNECFDALVKKFSPKKLSPYVAEFIGEDFAKADAVVFHKDKQLDYVLMDMEKVEGRLTRTADPKEQEFLAKLQGLLEKETLLCDCEFSEEEKVFMKNVCPVSYLPSVALTDTSDMNIVIKETLAKADLMLFYTAGEKEVHAWELKKGSTIVEAAGKIHTDLARGFIKGEVVDCKDLDKFFNMAEARAKGFTKAVDRDFPMQDGFMIEIKFSV